MAKVKTRKTLAKRFKITKSGKILRGRQGGRHLRVTKSKRRIRTFKEPQALSVRQANIVRSLINQ